jgi:hypothetical protein
MPKPKKSDDDRRGRPRQVKFTAGESASFEALARSVAAGGPIPLDAHLLLWLVEQECKRRSIPWPMPVGSPEAPPRLYPLPTPPQALLAAEAEPAQGERFVEREDAPKAPPGRKRGK